MNDKRLTKLSKIIRSIENGRKPFSLEAFNEAERLLRELRDEGVNLRKAERVISSIDIGLNNPVHWYS